MSSSINDFDENILCGFTYFYQLTIVMNLMIHELSSWFKLLGELRAHPTE